MWETRPREARLFSSNVSEGDNFSMEADVLKGFKFLFEIADNEKPPIKTKVLFGLSCSQRNGSSPKILPRSIVNMYDECSDHHLLHYPVLTTQANYSDQKYYSVFKGSKSEKTSCRPLESLEKYFLGDFKNPKLNESDAVARTELSQCFNLCFKFRNNNLESEYEYSFMSSLHPEDGSPENSFNIKQSESFFNKIDKHLSVEPNTTKGNKYKSNLLNDGEENSFEIIKIFKKVKNVKNIGSEKVPSFQSINSVKFINDEELIQKTKTKRKSKQAGVLAQDETFFRFERRGWICIHCLNFNFESKIYLNNNCKSKSIMQPMQKAEKLQKED